jgi:hypothetical protein
MSTQTGDIGTGGQTPGLAGAAPKSNPANSVATRVTEATRRPMSLPQLSLQVPDIPGYYLYWFIDTQIDQALQAGYEFVERDEVSLNNRGVADDQTEDGNDDLGSRVSRVAGESSAGNVQAQRLYLMKLRQEWRDKDVAALAERNESIAAALRGGASTGNEHGAAPQETAADKAKRYLKTGQDLFYPKTRRT